MLEEAAQNKEATVTLELEAESKEMVSPELKHWLPLEEGQEGDSQSGSYGEERWIIERGCSYCMCTA